MEESLRRELNILNSLKIPNINSEGFYSLMDLLRINAKNCKVYKINKLLGHDYYYRNTIKYLRIDRKYKIIVIINFKGIIINLIWSKNFSKFI